MTIQEQRTAPHDDDMLTELTSEEFHEAVQRALDDLGLTYRELEEQAKRRNFSSAQAHSLWMAVGGTVDI